MLGRLMKETGHTRKGGQIKMKTLQRHLDSLTKVKEHLEVEHRP